VKMNFCAALFNIASTVLATHFNYHCQSV